MASTRSMRRLAALAGLLGALTVSSAAEAAIPSIPNGAGGDITCTVQTGTNAGERWCSGIFTTFDGAPIDVNVGFPPEPASGPDGNFPIVGLFHGWGGSKHAHTTGGWIDLGYAFFSMSDRGWGMSCGGADPKRTQPVCANGYNHLMDTRFEVRDAQEIFEALADRAATGATAGEGLIHPQKIGATGGSYGGGMSMALGALKDRKMIQAGDGTLVPWVSDGGKPMRIAATQPDIPWTDLAYSLQPNGHTLDYVEDAPYMKRGRIGVMKQSFVSGLYATGQATSNYAAPGTDPDADLTTWFSAINAGEPYDQNPLSQDIVDEITKHHSSYYIEDSTSPAPMLISNGWTDDLFPADEAIRFYNRTRARHDSPISLIFTDHGHQRGQNKSPDTALRARQQRAWFNYYVKGEGPVPFQGVQTLTQACGGPSGGATGDFDDPNTDLPFQSPTWAQLAPGEISFAQAAPQTIAPEVSDQAGTAFDPIGGGGACATAPGADQAGTATYRLAAAPAGGYTLMGSPTVVADLNSVSATSQVAARLLDVDPATGNERLVARGLYRPEINSGSDSTRQVFQLHPNGWKFDTGHIAKLELLPADQPYGRDSNGQGPVTVSNLELRLPVLDPPGAQGGLVGSPAPKIVPEGYNLAADHQPAGYPRPVAASPVVVSLVPAYQDCTNPDRMHGPPLAFESCSSPDATSPNLTVGTHDANGEAPHFVGAVRLGTMRGNPDTPADEADVNVRVSLSDVRVAGAGLADYTGELTEVSTLRITDKQNGNGARRTGTVQDIPLPVIVPCTATPDTTKGADCAVSTSIDSLIPGAVPEGKRSVWALGQIQVFDGGPDGDAQSADNSLFAVQGIFVP